MVAASHDGDGPRQCPFSDALEMLGKKHTLSILWNLQQDSPIRFNELKRAADVNPVTLSDRLDQLAGEGIVDRTAHDEVPPRVDYALTDKGEDLLVVLDELETWAQRYDG